MQKGDLVKLQDIGVGKVESIYSNIMAINIAGTNYYRDLKTDQDIEPATRAEYVQFLKFIIKELSGKSAAKRKEAADYNKQVDGYAIKRKGKVTVINGTYAYGLCENSVSSHHRGLLADAKKAKETKEKLKKELEFYKGAYSLSPGPERKEQDNNGLDQDPLRPRLAV